MSEVLNLLAPLAVSVVINIALGMYYNIGKKRMSFNYRWLLNGLIKALIVGGSFVGLAYIVDTVQIMPEETPQLVMLSAIVLYVGKAIISLKKILGLGEDGIV